MFHIIFFKYINLTFRKNIYLCGGILLNQCVQMETPSWCV